MLLLQTTTAITILRPVWGSSNGKNWTQVSKQGENMAKALVYSTTNSTNLWHHVWFLFENKTRQPTITTTSIFRKHYPKPLPCSFVNYHADTVHPQIFPHFFHGYFHGENPKLEVPTIYKAYLRAMIRGYTPKIWPYMVQYLHFRILEFPLIEG